MNFILEDALMGLAGGMLIGLAATLFLLMNGRIAGISGILASALEFRPNAAWLENAAFVAGLIAAPAIYAMNFPAPDIGISPSVGLVITGGLLVGIGARLGSGCTSGHGVCGVSRFSPRSATATLTFMAVAVITVYVVRHVIGG